MNKFFLFFILILNSLSATDWKDHWLEAVEACNTQDYVNAENNFNLAINAMETQKEINYPHVYVDRARLYLLLEKYAEALPDIEKALGSQQLPENEKVRAIVTRIAIKSGLGISEGVLEDLNFISKNYAPHFEHTDSHLIIRNVPDCECFKNIMIPYLIRSGMCNSIEDIKILKSNIWVINKSQINKTMTQPNVSILKRSNDDFIFKNAIDPQFAVDGCKWWCDANALTATAWCTKVFKSTTYQVACLGAVSLIKEGCYWCCNGGNFYKKCIEPFEDIVSQMGVPCDPYWD